MSPNCMYREGDLTVFPLAWRSEPWVNDQNRASSMPTTNTRHPTLRGEMVRAGQNTTVVAPTRTRQTSSQCEALCCNTRKHVVTASTALSPDYNRGSTVQGPSQTHTGWDDQYTLEPQESVWCLHGLRHRSTWFNHNANVALLLFRGRTGLQTEGGDATQSAGASAPSRHHTKLPILNLY